MPKTPSSQTIPEDIRMLSFEAAMEQLETIVERLESGKVALADSIDMYERGATLKRHCESILKQAHARVEKIHMTADGTMSTSPLDVE